VVNLANVFVSREKFLKLYEYQLMQKKEKNKEMTEKELVKRKYG